MMNPFQTKRRRHVNVTSLQEAYCEYNETKPRQVQIKCEEALTKGALPQGPFLEVERSCSLSRS